MDYENKLKTFLYQNNIEAEHLAFKKSCHSVDDAANAAGAEPKDFIKSICMMGNGLIVGIVNGRDRASTKRISKLLDAEVRIARPAEILERTGYPVGGVPPFGYEAVFLIDPKVMKMKVLYGGGGSDKSLIKITPQEMLKANKGRIVRIRK